MMREAICGEYFPSRSSGARLVEMMVGRWWISRSFRVSSLIPRPETELLAEEAITFLKDRPFPKTMDLCTGSGCILISTAVLGRTAKAVGCDISSPALKVARENAERLGAEASFYEGDLFGALPEDMKGSFDIITANPPYIRTADIAGLMPEVREHEPVQALDGGADGIIFYRRIAAEACSWLKDGGRIYVEIGFDQADEVSAIFAAKGYKNTEVIKDLAGLDRVVCCCYEQ